MEDFIKINKDIFLSIIREYQFHNKKQTELIQKLADSIVDKSTHEVSTYSKKEFLYEKRRLLMARAINNEIDEIELKMLKDLTNQIRNLD
jgi:hypothetical protein